MVYPCYFAAILHNTAINISKLLKYSIIHWNVPQTNQPLIEASSYLYCSLSRGFFTHTCQYVLPKAFLPVRLSIASISHIQPSIKSFARMQWVWKDKQISIYVQTYTHALENNFSKPGMCPQLAKRVQLWCSWTKFWTHWDQDVQSVYVLGPYVWLIHYPSAHISVQLTDHTLAVVLN